MTMVKGFGYQLSSFAGMHALPLDSVPAHVFVSPAMQHSVPYLCHFASTRLTYVTYLEPEAT